MAGSRSQRSADPSKRGRPRHRSGAVVTSPRREPMSLHHVASGTGADRAAHDQAGPARRGSRSVRAASCERRRAARPAEAPAGRTAVLGGSSRQLPAHRGLSSSGHSSTAGRGFAQERMSVARVRGRPQSRGYSRSRVASPCPTRSRPDRRPVRLDPGVSTPPPGFSELTNHAKPIRGEATRRAHG